MPDPAPFFIFGSSRSGTNLLAMHLGRHARLEVMAESHFYPVFQPWRRSYEPLCDRRSLARFAREVAGLARRATPLPIDAKELAAQVAEPTVGGVFRAWIGLYARAHGKPRGGEKTPRHCRYVDVIRRDHPGAPLLLVTRDPRDALVSGVRSFGRTWADMAADWNAAVEALRRHEEALHLVRYESLVADPEGCLRRACAHLGEEWDPGVLDAARTRALYLEAGGPHERLREAVSARTVGRFRELDERRIAWIEEACAEGMRLLGYAPVASSAARRAAVGLREDQPPAARALDRLARRAAWTRRRYHWGLALRARLWSLRRGRP